MSFVAAFSQAMGVLGEVFNEPVSELRIEAYLASLQDLPDAEVLAAMRACVAECQFFPRPADIRQRVIGPADDRAELAWAAVLAVVQRVGAYGWPGQLDAPTMAAVTSTWGSWARLCETLPAEGPELLGWRKAFLANYGARARVEARDKRSRELPTHISALLTERHG
jgi:hypothetical protein